MKVLILSVILVVSSCKAAPHGFSLAHMQQLASSAKATRSEGLVADGGDKVKTLGELESLHVVGITTHPTDSSKLIYADETALYEFDKLSGESRMVAGGESIGLTDDRQSLDGEGEEAMFKYITKIIRRESGVYVFDYDTLRLFTPHDQMVTTVMTLFDSNWMEKSPVTGAITQAEDRVYFSTTEGYGHFVLSVSIPEGDLSSAELVTSGPSLISSMELSGDETYLLLGDVDAKTLVRVTLGEPNSEEFFDTNGKQFYPGAISVLNEAEMMVVNTMAKSLEVVDVSTLTESPSACAGCQYGLTNPLGVTVDRETHTIYVLDATSHPTLPTYKFSVKAFGEGDVISPAAEDMRFEDDEEFSQFMNYYMQWWYLKHRARF